MFPRMFWHLHEIRKEVPRAFRALAIRYVKANRVSPKQKSMFENVHLRRTLERAAELRNPSESDLSRIPSKSYGIDDVVFLLFLEPNIDESNEPLGIRIINKLIRLLQPTPIFMHVELFLTPTHSNDPHFSTYIGRCAGFGSDFGDAHSFYIDPPNGGLWRALPVFSHDANKHVTKQCHANKNTPYSLARYIFSAPLFRRLAWILTDNVGSPAHCAALTARILGNSLPDIKLGNPCPYYSPSTLFLELCNNHVNNVGDCPDSTATLDIAETCECLLRGSNASIMELDAKQIHTAILKLSNDIITMRTSGEVQWRVQEMERNLAKSLLRWAHIWCANNKT